MFVCACLLLWSLWNRSTVRLALSVALVCWLQSVKPEAIVRQPEPATEFTAGGSRSLPYMAVIADIKYLPLFREYVSSVGLRTEDVHHQNAVYMDNKGSGVWEAYRQASRRALDADVSSALIFEQDVELYANWTRALATGLQVTEGDLCDVYLLGSLSFINYARVAGVEDAYHGLGVCTEATLLSRKAMRAIIDFDDLAQDLEIDDWMRRNLRTCYYKTPAAGQNAPSNTILSTYVEMIYHLARVLFPFQAFQTVAVSGGRLWGDIFGKRMVIEAIRNLFP